MRKITLEELSKQGIGIMEGTEFLNNNINELLNERGIRSIDLATITCISKQNLSAIQRGKTKPSVVDALKIAHTLGVLVEDVFSLNEEKAWYIPYLEDEKQMYYDEDTGTMCNVQEKNDILSEYSDINVKKRRALAFKRLGKSRSGQAFVFSEAKFKKKSS